MKNYFQIKLIVFTVLIYINLKAEANDSGYKQIIIPLNQNSGIPFIKQNTDLFVDGFEINQKGEFLFLGGSPASLVCFRNMDQIFRKKFTEFKSNQIYSFIDKIYLFDYLYGKNNFFILSDNGNIITSYKQIVREPVNSFRFRDSCLIIDLFENSNISFKLFDLNGRYLKKIENRYNLTKQLYQPIELQDDTEFLGELKGNYLYWNYNVDSHKYIFTLRNPKGELINSKEIDEKIFGQPFYGNPSEHRKFKNQIIYILGHDSKNAIITLIDVNELFK